MPATSDTEAQMIVDWLRARKPDVQIEDDLDLIQSRVIDSLMFMEFIFLLQEVTGSDIAVDKISLDHFRTLRAIRANFIDNRGAMGQMEEMVL